MKRKVAIFALALAMSSIWWIVVASLCWWAAHSGGMPPIDAVFKGVTVALWPTPGTIRLVRQTAQRSGEEQPPYERIFLWTLSALAVVASLCFHNLWWVLPTAFVIWPFSAIWLAINSRFGVWFFTKYLGAKPIDKSTQQPPSDTPAVL